MLKTKNKYYIFKENKFLNCVFTSNIFGIISYWTTRRNCATSNAGSTRHISVKASLVSDWLNIEA